MTATQLNNAIEKVAASLGITKQEIASKLFAKDAWTWFLVEQAAK